MTTPADGPSPSLGAECRACRGQGTSEDRREGDAIHPGGPCDETRDVGWTPTTAGLQVLRLVSSGRRKGAF